MSILTLKDIPHRKAGVGVELSALTSSNNALNSERGRLAARASDLLGYKLLVSDVAGVSTFGVYSGQLTDALRKLDIKVLDASVVIDYQLAEVARRTKEVILEDLPRWTTGYFTPAQWSHTSISEYKRPVPEFVLDKAVRIKETLPNIDFYIQHLNDAKADPFLIARLGDEIYYIEAWDEPKFEAENL